MNTRYDGTPIEAMTGETEAEVQARWQAEAEQARADSINLNRHMAHEHLRKAAAELRIAGRAVTRLGESDLYDVEFEGHEATYAAARAQIDVAMAALTNLIPQPEASP